MVHSSIGFSPLSFSAKNARASLELHSEPASSVDDLMDNIKTRFNVFQKSREQGYSGKQIIADVIAGEYNSEKTKEKMEELINSAPCVVFTWERSPSCVKALKAFDLMNANVKIYRLDDPWSEGNQLRADFGKRVGRTSVPFVFIDGEYIGGYDGGTGEDKPGMVDLAFKGTLQTLLKNAGAIS
jgi:glutaredoxin-related protein